MHKYIICVNVFVIHVIACILYVYCIYIVNADKTHINADAINVGTYVINTL